MNVISLDIHLLQDYFPYYCNNFKFMYLPEILNIFSYDSDPYNGNIFALTSILFDIHHYVSSLI